MKKYVFNYIIRIRKSLHQSKSLNNISNYFYMTKFFIKNQTILRKYLSSNVLFDKYLIINYFIS